MNTKNVILNQKLFISILLVLSTIAGTYANGYDEYGGGGGYYGGSYDSSGYPVSYWGYGGYSYIGNGIFITTVQQQILNPAGHQLHLQSVALYRDYVTSGSGSNSGSSGSPVLYSQSNVSEGGFAIKREHEITAFTTLYPDSQIVEVSVDSNGNNIYVVYLPSNTNLGDGSGSNTSGPNPNDLRAAMVTLFGTNGISQSTFPIISPVDVGGLNHFFYENLNYLGVIGTDAQDGDPGDILPIDALGEGDALPNVPTFVGTDYDAVLEYNESASTNSSFFQYAAPNFLNQSSWSMMSAKTMVLQYYDAYVPRYHDHGRNYIIKTNVIPKIAAGLPAQYQQYAGPAFLAYLLDDIPTNDPEVFEFLAENSFSADALSFAKEAIDGGEINWNKGIINRVDNQCAAQVINDALSLQDDIAIEMNEFFGPNGSADYFLIYQDDDIPQTGDGIILAQTAPFLNGNNKIDRMTITFDNTFLSNATDLSVFATLIHENMHALMFNHLNEGNFENFPSSDFSIMADEWSEAVALRDDGTGSPAPSDVPHLQHEIISELVTSLADIIMQYGLNKGYNIDAFSAEALAWSGLQGTVAWTLLDADLKNTFENIIEYEDTNFEILSIGVACN